VRRHESGHDDGAGFFDVVAVEAAQRQPAASEALQKECAKDKQEKRCFFRDD
jgi:hypothetical protein